MPIIGATELQPVNILGSYMQGMELGRANQLARQQQAAQVRDMERKQQLNALLSSGVDVNDPQTQMQLLSLGGDSELKTLSDLQGNRLAQQKTRAEIEKLEADKKRAALTDAINFITAHDSPQDYPAGYSHVVQLLGPEQVSQLGLTPEYTPETSARLKVIGQSLMDEKTRLDLGIKRGTLDVQRSQADIARQNADLRSRELDVTQTRLQRDIDREKSTVARTETAADGTVRMYNKYGDLIKTEAGAGKPSATFEKTKAARAEMQRNLDQAIFELTKAVKKGGTIDQSTGSGIGRGIDIAAGMFGKATPGAVAIGKLQPVADLVLKMVPRFEGPQSDKDTQSYREAAGQLADATLPNEIRKAAGNEILRLMKGRKGQFTMTGAETSAGDGNWRDL